MDPKEEMGCGEGGGVGEHAGAGLDGVPSGGVRGRAADGRVVAEWRFGRGWSELELKRRLVECARRRPNFSGTWETMKPEQGWNRYYSESVVAQEDPGPPAPDGAFARARAGVESFRFSDPSIVTVHFDPAEPLVGRTLLLEIKVLGLRYLCCAEVMELRSESDEHRTVFGFRYDTREGHIERGTEWFLLTKEHETGRIRFRIEAAWLPGDFPNWWSRAGFHVLAAHYQRKWHYRAQARLSQLARYGALRPPRPRPGRLAHEGPEIIFEVFPGQRMR